MRIILIALLLIGALAYGDTERELAHIQVHEWGVLTLTGDDAVLSSVPGTPSPVTSPLIDTGEDSQGFLLRAPVLYFHGPAFSGTVTVKTNNGSIFDIYPSVADENRNHNYCSWTIDSSDKPIEEYPDFHGMAPGEWDYDLWRDVYALSLSRIDGWNDMFLYYETAPETTDFLPYRPGMESLCDEFMDVEALVIRRTDGTDSYSHCLLRDVVYGDDSRYMEISSEGILGVLYGWSVELIAIDEVDALWNTWSSWILRESINEPGYENGLVIYMIPADLTEKLSTISVVPDGPAYPVDISRYLLVAMPL